jgi:hypothetical protein
MVERKDQSQFFVIGGTPEDARAFAERDFNIRSGLCPNGHGLMEPTEYGQKCQRCGFLCNVKAEQKPT